jgi:hypothetical protein
MNNRIPMLVVLLAGACALGACDRPKSAAQVEKDTASAEQSAAERDSKAEAKAAAKVADARADVRSEQRDLAHVNAVQAEDVAITEAEGARKVALARCGGLAGDAQASCKDQANADFEAAKANAGQLRANNDPKP